MNAIVGGLARRETKKLVMTGLYPATVTPFKEDGSMDWKGLEQHLRETIEAPGVRGVVVNSGIGEILQLTPQEMVDVIVLTTRLRKPGQLIIAGVEGHQAQRVVEAGLAAKKAGADALLVLPPFDRRAYRKLAADVESVHRFFWTLDEAVDLPMVVFQFPPNSGCAYSVEALSAIAELPNVVAIKVATAGDFPAYRAVWDALNRKLAILVGVDSPPLIEMLRYGAHGALIGISAVVPEQWARLLDLVARKDVATADALFDRICRPLMSSIFENQQPKRLTSDAAATKEALFQLGKIPCAKAREPAFPPDGEARAEIREALLAAGLLKTAVA